jgi:hypothetical protein
VQQLQSALKIEPQARGVVRDEPLLSWLILALAHQRLGHTAEARGWLDKASQRLSALPKGRTLIVDVEILWAMCRVLRREAEELVPAPPLERKK